MSLLDLVEPKSVIPYRLRKRVGKLVLLAPDENDDRGRDRDRAALDRLAKKQAENAAAWQRTKADPVKLEAHRERHRRWAAKNREYLREKHRLERQTPAYKRYQREWMRRKREALGIGHRHKRGEAVAGAKLTADLVREMRAVRETGLSIRKLGLKFGVSYTAAHKIVSGASWAHVK